MNLPAIVRHIDSIDYQTCWQEMRDFTDQRDDETPDQLWLLEHPSVFTLGQAGKPEHILNAGEIPVVKTDRGGQVTWHGPGQTVIYLLLDIRRAGIGPRELVTRMENAVINYLGSLGLTAETRAGAPGVYVNHSKIASLGLRIRQGRSYHGLSLNREPDMSVFSRINPCGYEGQPVTSLAQLGLDPDRQSCENGLLKTLKEQFGFHYRSNQHSTS